MRFVSRPSSITAVFSSSTLAFAILIAPLGLAGCANTNVIVSEWRNPAYQSPTFRSILVGGVSEQTSVRRNFEDEFVVQLREAGLNAIASYRYVPEDEKVTEEKLKETARTHGVDAVLISRSVSVEEKTRMGPSYYPVPSFGIFGTHVSGAWQGPYGGPTYSRYTEYTSETTLRDTKNDAVAWSATVKTSEPENVSTAIRAYVEAVVNALKEKNLLGAPK
jgi:hypothetical protein